MSLMPKSKKTSKRQLGQFLTPAPVAEFMASLYSASRSEWRILDAGAGAGALSKALVSRICESAKPSTIIKVTAYELDANLLPTLHREYENLQTQCDRCNIRFSANILNADFVECASEIIRRNLFASDNFGFNAAILNPPYRKINNSSRTRKLLRVAGIETSNLYSGFLALALKLLSPSGELVAITPRSFCNGPYFRPFRKLLLESMSLRQIHVFESRSAAFSHDSVLQENVILHAVKSLKKPRTVIVSSSSGKPNARVHSRICDYPEIVVSNDGDSFIHLVTNNSEVKVRDDISGLKSSLTDLCLAVSTGRVVDFRAADLLQTHQRPNIVPLIRPCHFDGLFIRWPAPKERKACAILDTQATRDLLVPSGYYVLVKRFSAKEERRRIVASVYDPMQVGKFPVGFENHLNYFHASGQGFGRDLAIGLATFLNSTPVDVYFRHFSGHTQVNATDLRSIPYPTLETLEMLGAIAESVRFDQDTIDDLVHSQVFK